MAGSTDPSDRHDDHHQQDPAAAPATTTTTTPRRRLSISSVAILLVLGLNLGLCVRRVRDDRAGAAFAVLSHANLLLLFAALRRFDLSPPGSAARGRARLAVWLLTAALTAAFTWRVAAMLPLGFAVAAWVAAAATVVCGFYMLFLHGEK